MAMSERARGLRERLLANPRVEWSDPAELSRMSIEKSLDPDASIGRSLHSRGELRMHDSTNSHRVPLASVGPLLGTFQKLVAAIGAAHEGFEGLVGRLPAAIVNAMNLDMVAEPLSGSVVIAISPEWSAHQAEIPAGQLALDPHAATTKVDSAVEEALEILVAAANLGPDSSTSEFVARMRERGPRVSSATRQLLSVVSRSDFDLDLAWAEPHQAAHRATLTRSAADRAVSVFKGDDLESSDTTVTGFVVSGGHDAALHLRTREGEQIKITIKDLATEEISGLTVDSLVTVSVHAIIRASASGGDPEVIYRATAIKTEDPDETPPS